jgi:hypothetical protein
VSHPGVEIRVQVAADMHAGHCRVHVAREMVARRRAPSSRVCCGDLLLADSRGLELKVFRLQVCVRLAQHVVARLGVVQHLLQVLNPLVLALPVGPLRGTVLCSAALFGKNIGSAHDLFNLRVRVGLGGDDVCDSGAF